MSSEISLEARANSALSNIMTFQDEAENLAPEIRDDFNSYVKKDINPLLPDGYEFVGADCVTFSRSEGAFKIFTGGIKTPDGDEPQTDFDGDYGSFTARLGVTVVDKCLEYCREHPYTSMSFGFNYSGVLKLEKE